MSDKVFLGTFVHDCLEKGLFSTEEMVKEARGRIENLEQEIRKIEELRSAQLNYRAVIRHLGGTEPSKKMKRPIPVLGANVSEDNLDPYMHEVCCKICMFLENNPEAKLKLTVREIGDAILPREEFSAVLTGIKWLFDHGIITRDESSIAREIYCGTNWDKRPRLKDSSNDN